ncbi:hypothetical protein Bca52824_085949 [Brassica carinata]|uniref:Transcription factor MYC/MYB N-terminal domain-containing protein n=1 Tax=Brassica carinata TaxID=52824 RepID=A0A8X7TNB4_BRACI|nr:hypothetical protein Bca52824_085949 [Brassica carinata]
MVALHEALRTICPNTVWTYSVFWSIRPRPRVRGGGNSCKVRDDNGNLMLMWEDGYCRGRGGSGDCYGEIEGEDPVRKSFRKMSNQLMGKVASDKCHKWVFKEQNESESNASSYWQSSFDAIPTEWNDQFESGIQTIAVIQAGHGLLQLGSCKIEKQDSDVKWPTGLSFFNALTNNVNAKLLFDSEGLGDKPEHQSQEHSNNSESQANSSEFLSLDSRHRNMSFLE